MTSINRDALIVAARAARDQAYAPYSRVHVGAAVLTASGDIVPGCNIENAAYPSTNCAERVAMQSAWCRAITWQARPPTTRSRRRCSANVSAAA